MDRHAAPQWSQVAGDPINFAAALCPSAASSATAACMSAELRKRSLVLAAGTLAPGEYVMRLTATDRAGSSGSAALAFRVAGAPFGGRVTVDRTEGAPLMTFKVSPRRGRLLILAVSIWRVDKTKMGARHVAEQNSGMEHEGR